MERGYHVAIVGATGAVGLELLSILEERKFPVVQLSLLASKSSPSKPSRAWTLPCFPSARPSVRHLDR
jgi:aspartate-semialdehyde dehydrogenase